ncbi:DUF3253 domain-containing protein [Rhodobacter sp. NSM]|uniref:DUF3253 domain-containing protein n=1 Tax=Rhodobacter sp. NSM TaxID=3457501 RepID=UPI003FD5043B
MTCSDEAVRAVLMDLAQERGRGASFCPSEAARRLGPDWRARMEDVRRVAGLCIAAGELAMTQNGRPVDPATVRGPVRLSLP